MKRQLNTYNDIIGLSEYDDWSYCADNGMWYEDAKEILPLPQNRSEKVDDFSCTISFEHEVYKNDEIGEDIDKQDEKNLENFAKWVVGEDNGWDCVDIAIFLKTKRQSIALYFSQDGVWGINSFLDKLTKAPFATEYIEQWHPSKFIAWTDKDKNTRFVIHSYQDQYRFLETILDITVKQEVLISKLQDIVSTWKQTVYAEIKKQKALSKEKKLVPNQDSVIRYFFPEIFSDNQK